MFIILAYEYVTPASSMNFLAVNIYNSNDRYVREE